MSYIEKNLMPGESVVYRARLHWAVYLPAIFFALVSGAFCIASVDARIVGGLVFLFLVLPMGLSALVNVKTAEFAVTDKRVLMKFGFIRRTSLEVLLTKVEGIVVDQGIGGRVLGFGTIVVSGTGGSKTPFPKIAAPMRFRRAVQEQIEKTAEPAVR